ncbi:hypothetical protein, partial [Gemmatimonas sp.]|uniref:hypothetical protein n=1 Tax=Gemmatimonas sp. TaxID=1962908 RepID=UPI00391EEB0A
MMASIASIRGPRRRVAAMGFLFVLGISPSTLLAQDQTLIRSGTRQFGGFGGPMARVTTVAGETMVMGGAGGAFLLDRRFAIGGAG